MEQASKTNKWGTGTRWVIAGVVVVIGGIIVMSRVLTPVGKEDALGTIGADKAKRQQGQQIQEKDIKVKSPEIQALLQNEAFMKAMKNEEFCRALTNKEFFRAARTEEFAQATRDGDLMKAVREGGLFREAMKVPEVARALQSEEFLKAIANEDFLKAVQSSDEEWWQYASWLVWRGGW